MIQGFEVLKISLILSNPGEPYFYLKIQLSQLTLHPKLLLTLIYH